MCKFLKKKPSRISQKLHYKEMSLLISCVHRAGFFSVSPSHRQLVLRLGLVSIPANTTSSTPTDYRPWKCLKLSADKRRTSQPIAERCVDPEPFGVCSFSLPPLMPIFFSFSVRPSGMSFTKTKSVSSRR